MPAKSSFNRKPSRPSSINQLDPRIKEAVDTAVREGRASIDQILSLIADLGGEASRSAVGRYVKNARERMEDYRQAQQIAAVWVDKLGKEPEGDIGRMLLEMLRVVAFKSIGDIESASPEDLMFLGKALKDIAGADKLVVDRELNLRKLVAARAEKVAEEITREAKKLGASDEVIQTWRNKVLGVAAK